MSIMFNETCKKDKLLPKYTEYIYIYIYIYIYQWRLQAIIVTRAWYVTPQIDSLKQDTCN